MGLFESWGRSWRDDSGPRLRAMTAAGARVNLAKPALSHTRREQWQTESWNARDQIPEMRFAGDFVANTLGRLRVFAAENRPRGEEPVPLEKSSRRAQAAGEVGVDQHTIDAAVAAVDRLNLAQHGTSLLARMAENLEYAGECFLLGERDDEEPGGSWSIRSVSEIQLNQGGAHVLDPDSGVPQRPLKDTECDLMRLWTPHPRYYDRPDAPVRSLLDVLENMFRLIQRGIAHDKSRISLGKVFYLPSEFTLTRPGAAPVAADLDGAFDDPDSDPAMQMLAEYMEAPIADPSSPNAVVPLFVRGPAMLGDRPMRDLMGTVDLHGEDPKDIDVRYEAQVLKLARGINLPPERLKGIGEATNTWTANTITADEVKTCVEPRAERMLDALTSAYLQRMLKAMGVPLEQRRKVCLWFDPSELVQNPNRGADAMTLFEAGELSGDAARHANGFTDADKPTTEERLLRALTRGELANAAVPAIMKLAAGQLPTVADLTAVGSAEAAAAARAMPRPVVDVTPNRLPGQATPTPGPKPALPTAPPVGERTQPATATQPGALGASGHDPLLAAAWNPALHPRDHRGRFISTGSKLRVSDGREASVVDNEIGDGKVRVRFPDGHTEDVVGADTVTTDRGPARPGMRHYDAETDRDEMATRGVKIPPGYSNVQIADDPDSDLQWIGLDKQGRDKREYSAAHTERQAAEKFERVRELAPHIPALDAHLQARSGDDDTVAALRVIRTMGLRPGSDADTRTKHKARGATNLLVDNVVVDGDAVTLDFIGKEGVHLVLPVDDPDVASMLRGRVVGRGGSERLFATDEKKVAAELKRHAPQSMTKDLRTYLATDTAADLVKSMPTPATKREYQAARNQVGDVVSKRLGNRREQALKSYISPAVFADWDAALGAGGR